MSDLRRTLAKSKLSAYPGEDDFNPPSQLSRRETDKDAGYSCLGLKFILYRQAIANGTYKKPPPLRFPVILTPGGAGLISSPEKLKQLAEMESVPEVIETTQIWHDGTKKKVTICHVNFAERNRIEEKAEVLDGMDHRILVMFQGGKRYALVVKALKEGVTLEEDREEEEQAQRRKGKGKGKGLPLGAHPGAH
ncbi:hypothetical protein VTI74DRAFT_2540 [Chaetomium olivicolor]